ncbi:MFS transporter [Sulfodiicoccus acidiphilus]|uniref:MFS transporter n=1 Tax=Sulfodiicoccus acidiphilus TaxID=1670455 RepID=A0A348B691_9CREN|nr:MFS transporter [Sulfodiicoccus acidiphilus]BBD73693.1 MFS transporter [Sulfodiicoccus acidiphilus]GGT97703.1 MFS transporter [Sulfodiicoccus acidiphilus]
MVQYKWIALSNTTLGTMMATINFSIVIISIPAIFKGIQLNPLDSFQYLLWFLFGYSVVISALVVTLGRLSDMYGRVRAYNLGFAIFTTASLLLSITPNGGTLGALELIAFRAIQGLGGGLLFANSAAIITDAFPEQERGKALGINQISAVVGTLVGLVLGGVLSVLNWRYVFLVNVPFGAAGTMWSYLKLKELSTPRRQRIDVVGNLLFSGGLVSLLVGVTYGLLPYGGAPMGWGDPLVWIAMGLGGALLVGFPFVEAKTKEPMFRVELFRDRSFAAANAAGLLNSMARGGVLVLLVLLLQGVWLPLHGYSFQTTPFWSGIYLIPMTVGTAVVAPFGGILTDKYGPRWVATGGALTVAAAFVALMFLPYDFQYPTFALIIFAMGVGNGFFGSPNTAAIMNSSPREHRGAASGMRATMFNVGQTVSIAVFFTAVVLGLNSTLPQAVAAHVTAAGAPQLSVPLSRALSPTGAVFATFLGYNPLQQILASLPASLTSTLSPTVTATLTSNTFFPEMVAGPMTSSLDLAFLVSAVLSAASALLSSVVKRKVGGVIEVKEVRAAAR